MTYDLRYYQQEAVKSVWDYFENGGKGNPLIALATGTGKSLVNAELIRGMVEAYPQTNILCVTHVKELITNNHKTLIQHAPAFDTISGIFSAGVGRKDTGAQVTFGGIQSIAKRAPLFSRTNIALIDEAHLIGNKASSQYVKFLMQLRSYNKHLKVIGLTATPYRMGMGLLTDGDLFTDIVYNITEGDAFMRLVDEGYLSALVTKKMQANLDTENVKLTAGEFNDKSVQEAMDAQGVIVRAIEEAVRVAAGRRHWMVFTNSIKSVDLTVELLRAAGVSAAAAHSDMPSAQRDEAIAAYQRGEVQAIVNKDMLTTGIDAPHTDCIVMLRPTRSPGLWVQMLGRGTRPAPDKANCLVLDFVGNTLSMGPINYPQKPKPRRAGAGEPPVRPCPGCDSLVHISVPVCPDCGYQFPPPKSKILATAGVAPVMLRLGEPEPPEERVVRVVRMTSTRHRKHDRPDSVKVTYYAEDGYPYTVWVGLDHPHPYVKRMAEAWWAGHRARGDAPLPASTDELLENFEDLVRVPYHLRARKNGKFWEVLEYDFLGSAFKLQLAQSPKQIDEDIPF